ncbi:unnamed protein product [Didymodactylos carnosus]|uniref:Uncharacterized protein n=1 Tax=Didymodactylos carnosus TaxID=1234261 RepID=A0A8S2X469_9BILA|nr:unnamed protein product [Didymodactylos carnosus]
MLQCVYQQLPLDRNEASNVIDQIPDVNKSSGYDDYEGVNNLCGVVSDINGNESEDDEPFFIEDQPEFISLDEDYREGMTIEQSGVDLHSYRSNEDDSKMVVDLPRLHHYTNVHTHGAVDTLLCWLRALRVCKSHGDEIVKIIRSWLPVPNNLPSTLERLLSSSNVLNNFNK